MTSCQSTYEGSRNQVYNFAENLTLRLYKYVGLQNVMES